MGGGRRGVEHKEGGGEGRRRKGLTQAEGPHHVCNFKHYCIQ